ncbi:MAG: GUN4 domain-containing protein [Cyanobacteria bacterium J06621_15]
MGYEYLAENDKQIKSQEEKYKKAKENLDNSLNKLNLSEIENKLDNKNRSNLATLVYIYYVKGQLAENSDKAKALEYYKKALDKYNKYLKAQFKSPLELFKLDLNILYNGNADIVAALYRKLKKIDSSNTVYTQALKQHLLSELDYLMQEKRWREADEKNWQFILVSAGREKRVSLRLNYMKNFKCGDLKQLDELWVENSQGHFGYSVQKKIYLSFGNSLDFDWKTRRFRNWNEEGYNKFAESLGWKKGGKWLRYEQLPMNLSTSERGELPSQEVQRYWNLRLRVNAEVIFSSCRDL